MNFLLPYIKASGGVFDFEVTSWQPCLLLHSAECCSLVTHFICKNTTTTQTIEYYSLYSHYKIALKNEAK